MNVKSELCEMAKFIARYSDVANYHAGNVEYFHTTSEASQLNALPILLIAILNTIIWLAFWSALGMGATSLVIIICFIFAGSLLGLLLLSATSVR